jgi:hypothetical protein
MEQDESYPFATIPTVENANIDDDIRYLLAHLADAKLDDLPLSELAYGPMLTKQGPRLGLCTWGQPAAADRGRPALGFT